MVGEVEVEVVGVGVEVDRACKWEVVDRACR